MPAKVDPNTLIDQIMIDPHATAAEDWRIKGLALAARLKNEVLHSHLFELPARLSPFALRPQPGLLCLFDILSNLTGLFDRMTEQNRSRFDFMLECPA